MEQVILEVVSKHMKNKMFVRGSQHGFMKLSFSNQVAFSNVVVEEVGAVEVVYLDFSKAIDTVSQNSLMDELMKHRLSGQWGRLKTVWAASLKGLWSGAWSPAGGQSLVGYPRGQYRGCVNAEQKTEMYSATWWHLTTVHTYTRLLKGHRHWINAQGHSRTTSEFSNINYFK